MAAMRSQTGASYRLLLTIGHLRWQSVVTTALMYEYEDVLRITDMLDLIYHESHRQMVWFSWRPLSFDPGDDAVLEAAIAGGCDYVLSSNERHLRAAREFGIEVLKPPDLLRLIGEIK